MTRRSLVASSGTCCPAPATDTLRRSARDRERPHHRRAALAQEPDRHVRRHRARIGQQHVGLIAGRRKPVPTRPSARPQRCLAAVTPKLLCASYHSRPRSGRYCARSTTIGSDAVDPRRDRGVGQRGRRRRQPSIFTVSRPWPESSRARDRRRRVWVRNVSVASTGVGVRIGQQHERLEERAGGAFGQEPGASPAR